MRRRLSDMSVYGLNGLRIRDELPAHTDVTTSTSDVLNSFMKKRFITKSIDRVSVTFKWQA